MKVASFVALAGILTTGFAQTKGLIENPEKCVDQPSETCLVITPIQPIIQGILPAALNAGEQRELRDELRELLDQMIRVDSCYISVIGGSETTDSTRDLSQIVRDSLERSYNHKVEAFKAKANALKRIGE